MITKINSTVAIKELCHCLLDLDCFIYTTMQNNNRKISDPSFLLFLHHSLSLVNWRAAAPCLGHRQAPSSSENILGVFCLPIVVPAPS